MKFVGEATGAFADGAGRPPSSFQYHNAKIRMLATQSAPAERSSDFGNSRCHGMPWTR